MKTNKNSYKFKKSNYIKKENPIDKIPGFGLNNDYYQIKVTNDYIISFSKDHKCITGSLTKCSRIDLYPDDNKIFISSLKNNLYLELKLTESVSDHGYKIEKVKTVGNKLYIFLYRYDTDENDKQIILKNAIYVNSVEYDNIEDMFKLI